MRLNSQVMLLTTLQPALEILCNWLLYKWYTLLQLVLRILFLRHIFYWVWPKFIVPALAAGVSMSGPQWTSDKIGCRNGIRKKRQWDTLFGRIMHHKIRLLVSMPSIASVCLYNVLYHSPTQSYVLLALGHRWLVHQCSDTETNISSIEIKSFPRPGWFVVELIDRLYKYASMRGLQGIRF